MIRQAKLPDPEFFEIGNAFQVIFYNSNSSRKRHPVDFENIRQKQAIAFLQKNPTLKTAHFAKMTGVSQPTAVKDLNELVKQGKLRKVGKFRGAYYELAKNIK